MVDRATATWLDIFRINRNYNSGVNLFNAATIWSKLKQEFFHVPHVTQVAYCQNALV